MSTMPRLYLVHWNAREAAAKAAFLVKAGYSVECDRFSPAIFREIRQKTPDVFVIDLSRLPSQGRDVALNLRQSRTTRLIPIVFVEGAPEKVDGIKKHLPDAIYTTWNRIRSSLRHALAHPPQNPVVPRSVLAGYADAPLQKKLGIKPNYTVALIDAPPNFVTILGRLPDGIKFNARPDRSADLTLWFVKSDKTLQAKIESIAMTLSDKSGLWICWPKKTSGVKFDLSQTAVRKIGLSNGLVDFKVCSIDQTWSGLKFRKRIPK